MYFADIAQSVERILGKDEVASSNLAISSRKAVAPTGRPLFCICRYSNWRPPFERAPASGYKHHSVSASALCAVPVRIWLSAPEKRLPHRGGRFFASVGIRTGDLHLSERQRADIGITALARQRYALCQFATAHKRAQLSLIAPSPFREIWLSAPKALKSADFRAFCFVCFKNRNASLNSQF